MPGGQQGLPPGKVPLFLPHSLSGIRRKRDAQPARPWTAAQRRALQGVASGMVSRPQ